MTGRIAPARWVPPLVGGVVLLGLASALGAVVLAFGNGPFAADAWWNDLLAGWTSNIALGFSWAMNDVGGGWVGSLVVPIGVAIVFLAVRRPWAAAYFLAASAASAGVVQIMKHVFGRARPGDIVVVSDFGSFPSGHTANAATIAVVMLVLFPRLWVALAGLAWVLLMAFSRTYLHAHWLSDTIGGALSGAGATLVVTAAMAVLVAQEAVRRRMPRTGPAATRSALRGGGAGTRPKGERVPPDGVDRTAA